MKKNRPPSSGARPQTFRASSSRPRGASFQGTEAGGERKPAKKHFRAPDSRGQTVEKSGTSTFGKPGYAKTGGGRPDGRSTDGRKTDTRQTDSRKTDARKTDKTVGGDRPWSKHRPAKPYEGRSFEGKFKPRAAAHRAGTDRPSRPATERSAPDREPRREAFRTAPNAVLIWGVHAARAAWLNPKRRVTRAWLSEAGAKSFAATRDAAKADLLKRPDPATADRTAMDRMLPPGSVHQGIVIEVMPLAEPNLAELIGMDPPPALILLLDQVTDPHNVGAILRSAAAFGAGAVVLTERNAPSATGVMAKSASGALDHVPLAHVVNLARALDDLREAGYWCVGLAEEGAKQMGELDLSGRTVLVLGNEGEGLRHLTRQKCDELARLPTGGPIGSLNVSNAAAVALYEVRRQAK